MYLLLHVIGSPFFVLFSLSPLCTSLARVITLGLFNLITLNEWFTLILWESGVYCMRTLKLVK